MAIRLLALLLLSSSLFADESLDAYLNQRGYHLTPSGTAVYEGYMTPAQKETFLLALSKYPNIQRIAEVGFNAGHTADLFLSHFAHSQLTSFDINTHSYTPIGAAFIEKKYGPRFQFIEGDSRNSVPEYAKSHPGQTFDLIYIDGCHLFDACLEDIFNFKALSSRETIVWIDDTYSEDVQKAIQFAEKLSIIETLGYHSISDVFGTRAWAEARYIFNNESASIR